MTIGIGFKCDDGIVLATDTQYTRGSFKSHGPKTFPLVNADTFSVMAIGAGHVPFMKRCSELSKEALQPFQSPTIKDIRECLEDVISGFYAKHVFPNPDKPIFEFLVGAWTEHDGFHLLKTTAGTTDFVPHTRCIGTGVYVSEYALDLVFDSDYGLTVEKATILAAFGIRIAKDYVGTCGGNTKINTMALTDAGKCKLGNVSDIAVKFKESAFEGLFTNFKTLLKVLDINGVIGDEEVQGFADLIRDSIIDFRNLLATRKTELVALGVKLENLGLVPMDFSSSDIDSHL